MDWISAQDALMEIGRVLPDANAGKELANGAMKAGFRTRARLAVFLAMEDGRLTKREPDFEIPPDWWWPQLGPGLGKGLQVFDPQKGEGWAIVDLDGAPQRVEFFGLSFHRADLAAHFGVDITNAPPKSAAKRRGAKPKYDWPPFQIEALRRMEYHGGFLPIDWGKSDLEREMAEWCRDRWGVEPGESTIRAQLSLTEKEYEARKTGR